MVRKEVIGDCTLYLADFRDVLSELDSSDSVCMDPPYGMNYESGHATDELWGEDRKIVGDKDTQARDIIIEWSAGRPVLSFGTWKVERPSQTKMVLIWDKGGALGMGDLSIPWKPDHEEIYVIGSGFIGTRDSGSVIYCPPVQSMAKNGRDHPNEKPVRLLKNLIRKLPGKILDPFMGVGSCGVACVQTGRPFIGVELKPHFFDKACRRIEEAYKQPDLFIQPSAPKAEQTALDI